MKIVGPMKGEGVAVVHSALQRKTEQGEPRPTHNDMAQNNNNNNDPTSVTEFLAPLEKFQIGTQARRLTSITFRVSFARDIVRRLVLRNAQHVQEIELKCGFDTLWLLDQTTMEQKNVLGKSSLLVGWQSVWIPVVSCVYAPLFVTVTVSSDEQLPFLEYEGADVVSIAQRDALMQRPWTLPEYNAVIRGGYICSLPSTYAGTEVPLLPGERVRLQFAQNPARSEEYWNAAAQFP